MNPALAGLRGERYINLETYKRDGTAVRTPIWFAEHEGELLAYSLREAGKIKRIRRDPRVRIAACDARGKVKGEWLTGQARILAGEEEALAHRLLRAKYGWQRKLIDLMARLWPRPRAGIAIRLL